MNQYYWCTFEKKFSKKIGRSFEHPTNFPFVIYNNITTMLMNDTVNNFINGECYFFKVTPDFPKSCGFNFTATKIRLDKLLTLSELSKIDDSGEIDYIILSKKLRKNYVIDEIQSIVGLIALKDNSGRICNYAHNRLNSLADDWSINEEIKWCLDTLEKKVIELKRSEYANDMINRNGCVNQDKLKEVIKEYGF